MADGLTRPDLYEDDFYLWTQTQAEALRAAGLAGVLPASLDWERLSEEMADMGKRDLRLAKRLARGVLEHLYKLEAVDPSEARGLLEREVLVHRFDLELEITPSIRELLEEVMEGLHEEAAKLAVASFSESDAPKVPRDRRWTLAQILGEEDDPLG